MAKKAVSKKTICPLSRKEFMAKAPPLEVVVAGTKFVAGAREFSTESLGYNVSGKATIVIDGKAVEFSVSMNVVAVGSKELPKE